MRLAVWNPDLKEVDVRWTWLPWFVAQDVKVLSKIREELNTQITLFGDVGDELTPRQDNEMNRIIVTRLTEHYHDQMLDELLLAYVGIQENPPIG